MTIDPLYFFLFAGLFSPGPNVILLTTSGARFGFRATIPHLLGVVAGVGILGALTGFGVGAALLVIPELAFILRIIAALWILWLARALFKTRDAPQADAAGKPFRFIDGVMFQAVNPKVWAIAVAAATGFASSSSPIQEAIRLAIGFSGVNFCVCLFWAATGHILRQLLADNRAWRVFITVMSIALAGSAALVFV